MDRRLLKGEGWRLGWNPHTEIYPGLVGGEDWAFELTNQEFADFCRFLQELVATIEQMAPHLMPEERIACELESDRLWMEVEGFPHSFSLRLIVQNGRSCEGNWSESAVLPLLSAIQSIKTQSFA